MISIRDELNKDSLLGWIKIITINYIDLYKMSFNNSLRCSLVMQTYLLIGICLVK